MLDVVYRIQDNLHQSPAHLMKHAEAQAAAYQRIARLPTTQARRGIRQGALSAGSAGTLFAHALALPIDVLTGHGPWLTPAWLQNRRRGPNPPIATDLHGQYGACRGLLGPPTAFAVGFAGGLAKMVGWGAGTVVGVMQAPVTWIRGDANHSLQASIARWGERGAEAFRHRGSASASLVAAGISDAARVPAMAVKIIVPTVAMALGAIVGALGGLRDCWPDGLDEAVQQLGLVGEQNSRDFLIVLGASLVLLTRVRPDAAVP
jgi:hypothetical protein